MTEIGPALLGRKVEHDERSRGFQARMAARPYTHTWRRYGAVLDQGNLGSCTGNAMAHSLNCKPNHLVGASTLRQEHAVTIYSLGTKRDQFSGEYPPVDTGSSALGVGRAAKELGYIDRYQWAFGLEHGLSVLGLGPLMMGSWWYTGMFWPDSCGMVRPGGERAGGHEYLWIGIDMEERVGTFLNSWSYAWGDRGRFYMTFDDIDRLLREDGDLMLPGQRLT